MLALMLSIVMVLSTAAAALAAQARVQDIGGHWAEKTMMECKEKGLSQSRFTLQCDSPALLCTANVPKKLQNYSFLLAAFSPLSKSCKTASI